MRNSALGGADKDNRVTLGLFSNYRRDVLETAGAAKAFLAVLEEGSVIFGWRVHAYVIMRNHYHLALETPKPNPVERLHWLQGTIAARFNRSRNERGHLFQGRYQAILLEDNSILSRVVNYIHLNPVRAGIVEAERAADFRWSSLPRFVKGTRFERLTAAAWLKAHGLTDTPEGWKGYVEQLAELARDKEEQKKQKLTYSREVGRSEHPGGEKHWPKTLHTARLTPESTPCRGVNCERLNGASRFNVFCTT